MPSLVCARDLDETRHDMINSHWFSNHPMVLRWIFPRHGGGWARRYFQFRRDISERGWSTKDGESCRPIQIFDFSRDHDACDAQLLSSEIDTSKHRIPSEWKLSDDRVIGGYSNGKAEFHGESKTVTEPADAIPFIRWHGSIDTTLGLQSSIQRSGFSALQSPEFPFGGANLEGLYNALEVSCRPSPGRIYTINLKVATSIPNDMYQAHIQSSFENELDNKELPFEKFVLPFRQLTLTAMGRERELRRTLDDNVAIESVGVVLMDGKDGEFCFDLASVRAVNV